MDIVQIILFLFKFEPQSPITVFAGYSIVDGVEVTLKFIFKLIKNYNCVG